MIFLPGLTILKKKRCLSRLSGWGVDPVVALHLRNAADYRLPTFGPHGTKQEHSWFQWIIKVIFLAGLTILKNGEVSVQIEWMEGWSHGCTPPRNAADYLLPTFGPHGTKLGHSWIQWIIKSDLSGWFDNSEKGGVFGQIEWMGGWSGGCTPPEECCRLPPTYIGPHGTKLGYSRYQLIIIVIFLAGLTILKKERCLGRLSGHGADPAVALRLRNPSSTAYLLLDHMAPN